MIQTTMRHDTTERGGGEWESVWLSPPLPPGPQLSSTQLTSVWSRRHGYWLVIFHKTLYSHSPQYWDLDVVRLSFIYTTHSVPQVQARYRSAGLWREADDCTCEHNSVNPIGHCLMCWICGMTPSTYYEYLLIWTMLVPATTIMLDKLLLHICKDCAKLLQCRSVRPND